MGVCYSLDVYSYVYNQYIVVCKARRPPIMAFVGRAKMAAATGCLRCALGLLAILRIDLSSAAGVEQQLDSSPQFENRTLKLLVSLAFPHQLPQFNPSWAEGPNIFPATFLAMDHINSRADILPSHRLELLPVDGGCEIVATTAVSTTIGLFNGTGDRVVGMIGPGCSTSSLHAAHVVNQPSIDLVHVHGGGSFLLEDRQNFPNSIGILGSTRTFVHLSLDLIEKSGWNNIAILYESSRVYYRSTRELFVSKVKRMGVKILFDSTIYPTFYPLDGVRDSLARIVYVFTAPIHSLNIMCLAHHMGMIYPAYQWVIVSRRLDDFANEVNLLSDDGSFVLRYGQMDYNCSLETLLNVTLNQTFLMSYQLMPLNESETRYANLSFNQFIELYNKRVEAANVSHTYWAYQFYDAVWVWALVLHQLTIINDGLFDNFQYGNSTIANMILDELYKEDFNFEGISGHISFNRSTGYGDRHILLYQIDSGVKIPVAYSNGIDTVLLGAQPNTIPDAFEIQERNVSTTFVAIFGSFQFLCFLVVVFLHILTMVYRNSKSVKASSPQLNHFAFAGVYLLILGLSLFLFIEVRNHTEIDAPICHIVWAWLFPIGFTLCVGTVIVRTWRLYRIFNHYLDPGKFISTPALITALLVLLSIDIIVAVIWTATDRRQIQTLSIPHTVETQNGAVIGLAINTQCRSEKHEALWVTIVYLNKLSQLTVMVTLALLTRRIPNKAFTTTSLRVLSYSFSGLFTIGLVLYYFLLYNVPGGNSNLRYSVLYTCVNLSIVLYIVLIFSPPLVPVLHNRLYENKKVGFSKIKVGGWLSTNDII